MTTLRIGELASKGNVHLETVRYYEREGLLGTPQRTLQKMKGSCKGRCSVSDCPTLESLDSEPPS